MKRQRQVESVIEDWEGTFLTLTLGSYGRDKLGDLLDDLLEAWKLVQMRWANTYGGRGKKMVRATEVTFNLETHAWHPHFHILVKDFTPEQLAWLPAAWVEVLWKLENRTGRRAYVTMEQQVLKAFRGDDEWWSERQQRYVRMSEYLAKEQTLGPMKSGVDRLTGGVSPFYLLELAMKNGRGSRMARERWSEYENAMRGRRWMVFSKGLLSALVDNDDLGDEGLEVDETGILAYVGEDVARLLTVSERAALVLAARCEPTEEGFAAARARLVDYRTMIARREDC